MTISKAMTLLTTAILLKTVSLEILQTTTTKASRCNAVVAVTYIELLPIMAKAKAMAMMSEGEAVVVVVLCRCYYNFSFCHCH